jgi:hypothetical protein
MRRDKARLGDTGGAGLWLPYGMLSKVLLAGLLGLLLLGCAEEQRGVAGWDQLDTQYRSDCAPNGAEAVLHAWKGGKRYCFRYTIERIKPREGHAIVVALAGPIPPN